MAQPGLEERVARLEGRVESFDERFDALERRFDAVDRRFDAVDRRFEAIEQRIDGLDAKVDRFREELAAQIRALDRKVGGQFTWLVGIQVAVLVAVITALVAR